jgi:transposase
MLLTAGNVHDIKGAHKLLDRLPEAKVMLADRGYDAEWFRMALHARGIASCIPFRKNRKPYAFCSAVCIAAVVIWYLD